CAADAASTLPPQGVRIERASSPSSATRSLPSPLSAIATTPQPSSAETRTLSELPGIARAEPADSATSWATTRASGPGVPRAGGTEVKPPRWPGAERAVELLDAARELGRFEVGGREVLAERLQRPPGIR